MYLKFPCFLHFVPHFEARHIKKFKSKFFKQKYLFHKSNIYKHLQDTKNQEISNMCLIFFPRSLSFFSAFRAVIYYINLAFTSLLLSKISPTLYLTFQMYLTFYIMFFHVPHNIPSLLYYRYTSIFHVFSILYLTLRVDI